MRQSSNTLKIAPSKQPADTTGLRSREGKWHWRGKVGGKEHSGPTEWDDRPENIPLAQYFRQQQLEALRAEPNKPKPIRQTKMSMDQAVEKFIAWYRAEHPRGGECKWAVSLMGTSQYYFESVAKIQLNKITAGTLEDLKTWRAGNHSFHAETNTVRKQLLLLEKFFKYCRKQGWMSNDPFVAGLEDRVEIPAEEESDQIYVLSPDNESAYLKAALDVSSDLHDLAKIMLYQGARPGEIMELAKANVDLAAKRFTIFFSRRRGKTKNAHRTLAITDQTFPIFEKRLQGSSQWLFPSHRLKQRKKIDTHIVTLQKAHQAVVDEIKLKCRIYNMRHTFATRFALQPKVQLPTLSMILGHCDIDMLNRYVHPAQADMDRAMQAFSVHASSDMLIDFEG